jgi:hypothetical protein
MAEHEFKLDTRFSDRPKTWIRPAAVLAAVLGVAGIILTMTTNVASRILPMEDRYLLALIPQAPDGAEPLSLRTLEHDLTDDKLTVSGTVQNRTDYSIAGLQVVIQIQDRFGFTKQTVSFPVQPEMIPTQGTGTFQANVPLSEKLSSYSIKFQLADGPFVPHRDERAIKIEQSSGNPK